ncbi:MAG: BamA/TamA family outer membrane protein [Flavobacteriaceae bacterium]
MNLRISLILIFTIILSFTTQGQEKSDTTALSKKELRKLKKQNKNYRYSILGGPGYTPDYGFLIGGSALVTFSTDFKDKELKRSVMPFAFSYIFEGGGSLQVKPQIFFNKDKFRIFGNFYFKKTFDNYYGVGYATNSTTPRGDSTTKYQSQGFKLNPEFLYRIGDSNLFYGIVLDITQDDIKNPAQGMVDDPYYQAQGGTAEGYKYFNNGLGIKFFYDTRDVPANAYKGLYLNLSGVYYSEILRGNTEFTTFNLDYRQYKQLKFISNKSVLAWRTQATINIGDTPIPYLAQIGSPFDLRGYYKGQFRDQNAMFGLVEYRHMFSTAENTKVQKWIAKTGFAAWGGVGGTGSKEGSWSPPLWNYGVGLRIEVQPRMNFRLDYGHDPINKQNLIYFNMTEAF